MDYDVLAEDLAMPEGPIAFPDGSVVFVEIAGGRLKRAWGGGKIEVIAETGGGPNGAALGPDGAVYVCNNGGVQAQRGPDGLFTTRPGPPPNYQGARIERVDLATGKVERLFTHCDGEPLSSPNDIVFDRTGGFWFTDVGKNYPRHREFSALYYVVPGCKTIKCVHSRRYSYNGVGLSPDERTLYVADMLSARLWAYDLEGPGEPRLQAAPTPAPARLLCAMNTDIGFDSMAITAAGNICVGTVETGGITTFTADGKTVAFAPFPDRIVSNICFAGRDLRTAFITLTLSGRIVRATWPEAGLPLNFCAYA